MLISIYKAFLGTKKNSAAKLMTTLKSFLHLPRTNTRGYNCKTSTYLREYDKHKSRILSALSFKLSTLIT